MPKAKMSPERLRLVAERFKVLAEPVRLRILQELLAGERTVTDLVEATGLGQANVSKHLNLLLSHGFVARRREGLFALYALADPTVFQLCDVMCTQLERGTRERQRILGRS